MRDNTTEKTLDGPMSIFQCVRDGYDEIATKYASARDKTSSTAFLELLNAHLKPNSSVLDLGCGAGLPVDDWLVNHGHRVIGLDSSAAMLTLARRNVPDARYHLHNMAALKTTEFSVEAVVSFFAIIHVDRRRHAQLLRRIRSFLPKDGMFLFTAGHSDCEGLGTFHGVPMHWSHFDAAKYRVLIESAGFSILSEGLHRGNDDIETPHPIFLVRAH